jgi:hypothetical protein
MAISNTFLTKFSNIQKKRDLFDEFLTNADSDQETPIVLNKDLPTKEEYEAKTPTSPSSYRDTMKAKIVDGDSNYTWQDAKQITVDRAKQQDYELKLRSDALGENKNKVVNSNKPVLDADWPGMGQLKCPTPADGRFVATGNGKGGEMFSRSQIKMAADKPKFYTNELGELRLWDKPYSESLWETGAEAAGAVSSLTPFRYTWEKAKEGKGSGMINGAWSHALLGALSGAALNKLLRNKKVYIKTDPETGETEEIEEPETSLLSDMLLGAGIGGAGGALVGYNFAKDHERSKVAFAMGPDPLVAINSKIMADATLDFEQRRALMNYIKTLPTNTLSELLPTIGSLFGAGAGAAIARKLLGMGLGGSVLGALLGGMMGHGIGYNAAQSNRSVFKPLAASGFSDTFGFNF